MNCLKLVTRPELSIVVPVYNEKAVLPLLFERIDALAAKISAHVEIILVDDGSRDGSGRLISARTEIDPRYRYIALSRNFGHQIAITAGMELARGDAVVVMDADLQDPPEVVLELIARWREGFEIVHARRRSRAGETWFKKFTADLFYRLLGSLSDCEIPRNVGDFRLVGRKALDTFKSMTERDRYVRGMFAWMGYRQTVVEFDREERAGGNTKYTFFRMLRLALDGVISFSDLPLRCALWIGAMISLASILYGTGVTIMAIAGTHLVSGWASLAVLISLLAGINLMMTGIVGLYVGRIHREAKQRPLYIVARDTAEEQVKLEKLGAAFEPAIFA